MTEKDIVPISVGRVERPAEVRVWDPVVRAFHWSLVATFALAWITGEDLKQTHELAGYIIVALVGLRLVWGVIGTSHARFSDFVKPPSAVYAYLRDMIRFRATRSLGHNPAGGAMIVALLSMLAFVSGTGWLTTMAAFRDAKWLAGAHEVSASLILVLVFAHVAGVVLSSFAHRENLIRSMITGRKRI